MNSECDMHEFLEVTFAVHVSDNSVASTVSQMAAHGSETDIGSERKFAVEVFSTSKTANLRRVLSSFELSGSLKWREAT
jgi:hypothetical protein